MFPVCCQCQTKRLTCIQSTQYMLLVPFQNILGMDPPECESVCVWCSLCVDMWVCACHNEYVCTMPTSSAHIHLSSELWLQYTYPVRAKPNNCLPSYSPTASEPDQQTADRHAPPLRKTRVQIPQHTLLTVHNSVPQCTTVCWKSHLTALAIWWKVLLQEVTQVHFCFFFSPRPI